MKIAVASGKGGTGKTTIAASLASLLALEQEEPVTYIDCDAEEPNGHLLLHPDIEKTVPVNVPVPCVDAGRCTLCGDCAAACQFHALAVAGGGVVSFSELCHGCGACELTCSVDAIRLVDRAVGEIRVGVAGALNFVEGRMNVGEASTTPIIRALGEFLGEGVSILDAPPGTACPAVEAMSSADCAVLVTEPTPFGLHDLRLAVDVARQLSLPMGVVVNRCDIGDDRVSAYCRELDINVLLEIPNDRAVARAYSNGQLPWQSVPSFRHAILELADTLNAWRTEVVCR